MTSRLRLILALLALAITLIVCILYFSTHKPITPSQAPVLLELGLALVSWCATFSAAHFLGRRLAPQLIELPVRERLALSIGLGLGVLGLFVLGLGAVGALRPWATWPVALVGLLLEFRPLMVEAKLALPSFPTNPASRALALFVFLMLALGGLAALAPSTAWDGLMYHLTGPKLYLAAGYIHHDLDLAHLGFPHWPAMLYTWAMSLGGANAVQPVHFTFACLTLALLPGLTNRVVPGRAWLAAAVLVSTPALAQLMGWAYVEWIAMFCVTAAASTLLAWHEGRGRWWLGLAGLFTGLSLATKYTTIGSVLGLTLAFLLLVRTRSDLTFHNGQSVLRAVLIFSGTALAVLSPWLIKNWLLTGNPVYPFFFPGKFWDSDRAFWYGRPGTGFGLGELLVAPWRLMVYGVQEEDIGPLWLALLPLLIFNWRSRSGYPRLMLRTLLVVSTVAFAVWFGLLGWSAELQQYRLLYPIFPLAAVLAAAAFDGLAKLATPQFRVRWVMGGLLGLLLALVSLARLQVFAQENPLDWMMGQQTEADYLGERLGQHYVAMQAINELPDDSRVLFLWEPRSYYCRMHCEPDVLLDRWWHLRRRLGSAEIITNQWRNAGVTHVLLFEQGRQFIQDEAFDPLTIEDWLELERLVTNELLLVEDFNGAYLLYALTSPNSP